MDVKEVIKRIIMLLVVVGVTALLLHPGILIFGGFAIIKVLLILMLAGIVARIVFKKSIKDIIFGDKED